MKRALGIAAAALILGAGDAGAEDAAARLHLADAGHGHGAMTDGEVRKVDKEQGKLTVKHAEIKSLQMPATTMVFRVKDKALLDKVKEGDPIKFSAEKVEGQYTITAIEARGHKH